MAGAKKIEKTLFAVSESGPEDGGEALLVEPFIRVCTYDVQT
jgi:hypothetical protein